MFENLLNTHGDVVNKLSVSTYISRLITQNNSYDT